MRDRMRGHRRHRPAWPLLGTLVAVFLGACTSVSGNRESRTLGIIVIGDGEPVGVIEAPETAQAGTPFDVNVRTLTVSTCTTAGDTTVDLDEGGSLVTVRAFDITAIDEDSNCTALNPPRQLDHFLSLTFSDPGEATIRVEGRRITSQGDDLASVEVTVVVE